MTERISILLLEDNQSDALLIQGTLESGGLRPVFQHVESGQKFEKALRDSTPDLIISDFSIPGYSGKRALEAAQSLSPDVPFIFYSGTIGEEAAIEALKCGATDYVLKDKPKRLIAAIQRALRESAQRRQQREAAAQIAAQAQLLNLATDAIIVRDLEDRIEFWNQGAERLYGFTRAEILGRKSTEFIPPASQEVFNLAKRLTVEQGHWEGEKEHVTKDGNQVIVMSRWTLVRNQSGEPERILAINTDITEKKRLEKQFLRAQRLESVGTLASGIAHDLNNILAPILMACEFLKDVQPTREAAEMMDMALKCAKRGTGVVNQLLTFVRGTDGKHQVLDTKTVLAEIWSVLKKSLPENIAAQCEIATSLLPIKADATQLHQVLMNLCINARDAMPQGGKLTVTAGNSDDESRVVIRVQDTGTGMPAEVLDRIFDPFFTTKEPGKGTGLGLSTLAGIIKSHGGTVKVDSHVGAGTVFEVVLPAYFESLGPETNSAA
jgi:two-component system, cell cycle sensor histidine kinase and response regulator CckA